MEGWDCKGALVFGIGFTEPGIGFCFWRLRLTHGRNSTSESNSDLSPCGIGNGADESVHACRSVCRGR